jgi:hypothetical protein
MRGISAIVIAVGLAFGAVAHAQPADDAKKQAREHYKNAETAMAAAAYEYAASEYGAAYELMKDPVLFFKIGDANQKAGKCAAAVTYYKRYLKEGNPNESFKKDTEARITACGGSTAPDTTGGSTTDTGTTGGTTTGTTGGTTTGTTGGTTTGTTGGTTTGTTGGTTTTAGHGTTVPPDDSTASLGASLGDEKPSGKRTVAWISLATGLAAGTIGGVLLLSASSTEKDIEDLYATTGSTRPPAFDQAAQTRYNELVADGNRFNTLAEVSFGVAGAAAVTAIILFATDHGGEKPEHALLITPTVTPGGGGFAATFRF